MYNEHNMFNHETGVLWKDENFDIASFRETGASPPDVVTIPGTTIDTVAFDGGGTTEEVNICKELNHDYQEGTPISFHIHWYPTNANAGNVKWNIAYWINHFGLPGTVASGIISVISATAGVSWQPQISMFPDIDLGEVARIGTQIHFRLYRDPTDAQDTYGSDVAVATVGYHYRTNSRGSAKMTEKI